jgi:predicted GNAT superfamily acetyltransferase
VRSPWVETRLAAQGPHPTLATVLQAPYVPVTHVVHAEDSSPRLASYQTGLRAAHLVVEVPADFQPIMADRALAEDWRAKTRDIFLHYLNERGYVVTDCVSGLEGHRRRNLYVLVSPPVATAWTELGLRPPPTAR